MNIRSVMDGLVLITAGITTTSDTSSFVFTGAVLVPDSQSPLVALTNGEVYAYHASYYDGVTYGFEAGYGVWSGGNTLSRINVKVSHQSNNTVNWGAAQPKIVKIVKGREHIARAMFALAHKKFGEGILAFITGQSEMFGAYPMTVGGAIQTTNSRVKTWMHTSGLEAGTGTSGYSLQIPDMAGPARTFNNVTGTLPVAAPVTPMNIAIGPLQGNTGNIAWSFANVIQQIFDVDVAYISFASPGISIIQWEEELAGSVRGPMLQKMVTHWATFLAALPSTMPQVADFFLWSQGAGDWATSQFWWAERFGFLRDVMLTGKWDLPRVINDQTRTVLVGLPSPRSHGNCWAGHHIAQDFYPENTSLCTMDGLITVDGAHQSGDNANEVGRRAALAGYYSLEGGKRQESVWRPRRLRTSLPTTTYVRETDGSATLTPVPALTSGWRYHSSSKVVISHYDGFFASSQLDRMQPVDSYRFMQTSDNTKFVVFRITDMKGNNPSAGYILWDVVVAEVGAGGWPTVGAACTGSVVTSNLFAPPNYVTGYVWKYAPSGNTVATAPLNYDTDIGPFLASEPLEIGVLAQTAIKNVLWRTPMEVDNTGRILKHEKQEYHIKKKTAVVGAVSTTIGIVSANADCRWSGRALIRGYRSDTGTAQFVAEYIFYGQRASGVYTGSASLVTGSEIDGSTGAAMAITFNGAGAGNLFNVNGITGETWQWTVDIFIRELETA